MMSQSRGAEVSPYLASYIDAILKELSVDPDLCLASVEGMARADEAMKAITEGAHIDEMHPQSHDSVLHYAALSPYPHHVTWLLQAGVNTNVLNARDDSPLHLAVQWGRIEAVSILLDANLDLEQTNAQGKTPKDLANEAEDKRVAAFIQAREARIAIRKVVDPNSAVDCNVVKKSPCPKTLSDYQQSLEWPRESAEKCLAILLASGDDRHAPLTSHCNDGIVHDVAVSNYPDHLQRLIDAGVDPQRKGESQRTALHLAAKYGKVQACLILLQAGLDPDQKDVVGITPRSLARTCNYADVLALFDAHGASNTIKRIRLSEASIPHLSP